MKILVSPGFGAGWSTWASGPNGRFMLTYQPIIEFLENGGDSNDLTGEWNFPHDENDQVVPTFEGNPLLVQLSKDLPEKDYAPFLGATDLEVVDVSGKFKVDEYDGSESVTYATGDEWIDA